jgi:hypothetical protein
MAVAAPVAVVAGINNELSPRDFQTVKQLVSSGNAVDLFYVLPQVPALMTQLPEENKRFQGWHRHAKEMLGIWGNKLDISPEHRHFIDEIIGPDEFFDEARKIHAKAILTSHPEELKQRFLTRGWNYIRNLIQGGSFKELPVLKIAQYEVKGEAQGRTAPSTDRPVMQTKPADVVRSLESERKQGPSKLEAEKKVHQDVTEEENKADERPRFKR